MHDEDFDCYIDSKSQLYTKETEKSFSGEVEDLSLSILSTECAQQCDSSTSCVGFSTFGNGTGCALSDSITGIAQAIGDIYKISYSRQYIAKSGLDFVDHNIAEYNVTTILQCFQLCDITPGCEGVSYTPVSSRVPAVKVDDFIDWDEDGKPFPHGWPLDFVSHESCDDALDTDDSELYSNPPLIPCILKYALVNPPLTASDSQGNFTQSFDVPPIVSPMGANFTTSFYIPLGSRNYTLVKDIDFPGNDLIAYSDMDRRLCFSKCDQMVGCVGFVISNDTDIGCTLKRTLTSNVSAPGTDLYVIPGILRKFHNRTVCYNLLKERLPIPLFGF